MKELIPLHPLEILSVLGLGAAIGYVIGLWERKTQKKPTPKRKRKR